MDDPTFGWEDRFLLLGMSRATAASCLPCYQESKGRFRYICSESYGFESDIVGLDMRKGYGFSVR
jgi:hypothetical protein